MRFSLRPLGALLGLALGLASTVAHAQQATGFALDRFEPSERGSDWFTLESLDLRGSGRPALGIVGDYAYRPLAIYAPNGTLRSAIVSDQLVLHVGASVVLFDRLRLGVNLPVSVYQAGDGATVQGVAYPAPGSAAVGDLRIGADLRLLGTYGDPFTLGLGVQGWVPIGSQKDYTGDEDVRIGPRLLAAGQVDIFAYAARFGVVYRGRNQAFDGAALGTELTWGASAGLSLAEHKLLIGPEVFGSGSIENSDQIFGKRTTPLEGLFGAHYKAGDFHLGAGVGTGLTRGLGAPTIRALLSAEWAPAFEEKPVVHDRDGDGIPDEQDACPDVKGVRTSDPKTNGCPPPPPPPPDRDGDGISDDQDACPDTPGVHTDDPKTNGCPPPPPDRDHDGVIDSEDACPDVAGEKTNDPKTNGCPPDPDRDKDGIPNTEDACPDEPGPKDPDPKKNGCPKAIVRNNQIVILEQVKFATGSARILPASEPLMNAVLKVFVDHSEI
jgi:hypothetical protein